MLELDLPLHLRRDEQAQARALAAYERALAGFDRGTPGYVGAAAWVQAQLICGVQNIGWDATLAADLGQFRSSQNAFDAYRQTVQNAVGRGHVRVTVPAARARLPAISQEVALRVGFPPRGHAPSRTARTTALVGRR
jgi:hypothetical protein